MLYLILAMVSSMLVSVVMRLSEGRSSNQLSMLAVNYLMCTGAALVFTGVGGPLPTEGLPLAAGMGLISGVLFLAGFMLLQWNITRNGVVLPATFMKLGVLVPTVMSMLVFGETPRITQLLGIAAALAAIVMIQGGDKTETKSAVGLIVLLLVGGTTDAMSKIYEEVGPAALKNHYLLFTFVVALVLCVILCVVRKQKLTGRDVLFGLALGVPNYFSARFLLLSLQDVPAVVAYPSYSVGTIVLVALAGLVMFGEKFSRRKLAALGVILGALVLLNV